MESAGHDECPIANAEKEVNLLQLRMMKIDRWRSEFVDRQDGDSA